MADKILFVAGLGRFLNQFVQPLASSLQSEGIVTIAAAEGMTETPGFDRAYALPPFRRRGPTAAVRALSRLHEIVAREQPELLHLHTPPAVGLGRIVGKQLGIPTIAVIHTTFLTTLGQRSLVFALGEVVCARWSAATIVLNSRDAAFYRRHASADTVAQAPVGGMGIDIARIHAARASPSVVEGSPAVIVVGRLTAEKRLDLVVDAFTTLRLSAPKASLTFLGSAHEGDSPWSVPPDSGISTISWVDNPYPLIAGADVLVSASGREGFPMVVAEAVLLGTPVVSTSNRGVADIAMMAPTTVHIAEPNAIAIAQAILRAGTHGYGLAEQLSQRWSQASAITFHKELIYRRVLTPHRNPKSMSDAQS